MIKIDFRDMGEKAQCCGCSACANVCPKACIEMQEDDEGFLYPMVRENECIKCSCCEKACPIITKKEEDKAFETEAYAAYNKDLETRLQSSSGGVFTLLAKYILEKEGVVFGAALTEDGKLVEHICVGDESCLSKLQGSKYVQSQMGETYSLAKTALDSGKAVLFTGTPCQIEGLYSFLGKDYDNLITQDIICHGVPSPKVWKTWIEELEKKYKSEIETVSFRDKKYGGSGFSCKYSFKNKKQVRIKRSDDLYMRAFLSDVILRPSCYNCAFKSVHRRADITLADFWGINHVFPDMNDNKGISLVLVHSLKGKKVWNEISEQMCIRETDPQVVNKCNPAAVCSAKMHPKRYEFMSRVEDATVSNLVKTYVPRRRILNFIKRGIRFLKRKLGLN